MGTNNLESFLVKAKKNTYAAGMNKVAAMRPGAIDFSYKENNLTYVDSYFGNIRFSGQEVVYDRESPVWSMNYYGKTLVNELPDGFSETLKGALMLVQENAPYRGPSHYRQGDFEYTCYTEGTIESFTGEEFISHKGETVYCLYFHGGSLK
jgi:hypothetical protein